MLPAATTELRQRLVVEYLCLLPGIRTRPWLEAFDAATSLPERLLLLHPIWFEGLTDVRRVQGPPAFVYQPLESRCKAEVLWGYDCPLHHERIQADHVFPYSLGGPTIGMNRLSLCAVHNGWKGADLGTFPWERGTPDWIDDQLTTLRKLFRSTQ